jgi:hypothetical protein
MSIPHVGHRYLLQEREQRRRRVHRRAGFVAVDEKQQAIESSPRCASTTFSPYGSPGGASTLIA